MLTRKGILLGLLAIVVTLGGRTFAILELYVMGAAMLGLVVVCFVYVSRRRVKVDVGRALHPAKVYAGEDSRVELALRNISARKTPVVTVRDPFAGGRRWARFLVPPIAPAVTARAAYRLPTDRRGIFTVGPLELTVTDPFGLAAATRTVAEATHLTVFPRIDDIVPLPFTIGNDPRGGADRPNAVGQSGEEFYALRPYEMGDDLRRVHWPSTARLDELMIRQEELPWQGRATVLVDVRRAAHTPESLELAISAAASIVVACTRRGSNVRLVSADGFDSGFSTGRGHVEAILTRLAGVESVTQSSLNGALAVLRRGGRGGSLAVVSTATLPAADLEALARLSGRYGKVVQVLFERSAWDPTAAGRTTGAAAMPGSLVIRPRSGQPFATAWNSTFGPVLAGSGRR